MEKIIEELKGVISLKGSTNVGDIVLIASKEPQMLIYAYVLGIESDKSRREEWWNIDLAVLSMPPQKMTWTLRTPQMTGQEIFSMGGEERYFKAVDLGSVNPLSGKKATGKRKKGIIKRIK